MKEEDTLDGRIKAEPGHHDKISMGLFPSDVKKESDQSTIKTEKQVKCENKPSTSASSSVVRIKTESAAGTSSNKRALVKSEDTGSEDVIAGRDVPSTAGQRRGRSAVCPTTSDTQNEDILFLKRRGAILR